MLGSSMQVFSLVIPFSRVLIVVRHAAVVSMLPTKCGRLGCSFSLAELCSTRSVMEKFYKGGSESLRLACGGVVEAGPDKKDMMDQTGLGN